MSTMKGPAIFLAQFAGSDKPFDNLDNITRWAGELGYKGVQIPTWEADFIDLKKEDGAREGVEFINQHIIRTTDKAFDDFAGGGSDEVANRRILGIE